MPSIEKSQLENSNAVSKECDKDQAAGSPPRLLLFLPFLCLIGVLTFSPNYRWDDKVPRTDPFGGDFLQEWVGGKIVLSADRPRLYDLEFVKAFQHDDSEIGFQWPAESFFPMVYPPFHYYLVSPLSNLSYRTAVFLWAVFSALALSVTGLLAHRFYAPCRKVFSVWFVALAIFAPWLICLNMGQKSVLLLLLFTSTFLLQHQRRPFWAGLVFGLVAIKPQLGLVIGLAMVFKRQWWFVLGSACSVGVLVGISFLIEPSLWADFIQVVSGMGDYVQTSGYQLAESHSLWGATELSLSFLPPTAVKVVAAIGSLVVVAFVGASLRGKLVPALPDYAIQFSVMVLATILISPHFYTYDLTLLLLPLLLIFSNLGFKPEERAMKWAVVLSLALFAFAGLFSKIATSISLQPSIFLMFGLMLLLSGKVARPNSESQRAKPSESTPLGG